MCGQAGIIFGRKRRSRAERKMLADIFTRLVILNEERGTDASGVATMNAQGRWTLYKENIAARRFVRKKAFREALEILNENTTLLAGHTRWATIGSPTNPRNNHPIMAGHVIGTHNGTITNANAVAKTLRLPRRAEVDSEVIFRIANETVDEKGIIDLEYLKSEMYLLRGEMSAVVVSRTDPSRVIVLKGTKPLAFRYSEKMRAMIYSSEALHLDSAIACTGRRWEKIKVKQNSCVDFECKNPLTFSISPFRIQKKLGATYQQPRVATRRTTSPAQRSNAMAVFADYEQSLFDPNDANDARNYIDPRTGRSG